MADLRTFVARDTAFIRSRCDAPGGLKRWLMQSRSAEHKRWHNWLRKHEARVRADPDLQAVLTNIEQSVHTNADQESPQKRRRLGVGDQPGGEEQTRIAPGVAASSAATLTARSDERQEPAPRWVVQSGATPSRGDTALPPPESPAAIRAATPLAPQKRRVGSHPDRAQ